MQVQIDHKVTIKKIIDEIYKLLSVRNFYRPLKDYSYGMFVNNDLITVLKLTTDRQPVAGVLELITIIC